MLGLLGRSRHAGDLVSIEISFAWKSDAYVDA